MYIITARLKVRFESFLGFLGVWIHKPPTEKDRVLRQQYDRNILRVKMGAREEVAGWVPVLGETII